MRRWFRTSEGGPVDIGFGLIDPDVLRSRIHSPVKGQSQAPVFDRRFRHGIQSQIDLAGVNLSRSGQRFSLPADIDIQVKCHGFEFARNLSGKIGRKLVDIEIAAGHVGLAIERVRIKCAFYGDGRPVQLDFKFKGKGPLKGNLIGGQIELGQMVRVLPRPREWSIKSRRPFEIRI